MGRLQENVSAQEVIAPAREGVIPGHRGDTPRRGPSRSPEFDHVRKPTGSVCPATWLRNLKWTQYGKLLFFILGCGIAVFLPVHFTRHPYLSKNVVPHLAGIIGSVMMTLGAVLYAIRKRVKALKNLGKIKHWLDFHIVLCLFGPLLVVYHTAFAILAPNSGIAVYAMLIVVASGVVGRYIYRHFQFSLSGERATLREMNEEADQLSVEINERFSESRQIIGTITKFYALREAHKTKGLLRSSLLLARLDWLERKLKHQIRPLLSQYVENRTGNGAPGARSVETILVKRISLEKKIAALEATTRLFSFWHKLHVPLIWLLVFTFAAHVAAVLIF